MARKSVNKSQAIRDYLTANPNAKPAEIQKALAGKGIKVSTAFVSMLKSNDLRKSTNKVATPSATVAARKVAPVASVGNGSSRMTVLVIQAETSQLRNVLSQFLT